METGLGFSNFLTQLDGVGISVLVLLLTLSVASWYLILTKSISNFLAPGDGGCFSQAFLGRRFLTGGELDAERRLA